MQTIHLSHNPILTVYVQSDLTSIDTERRFNKSISIAELKIKLEPITGIPSSNQKLSVWAGKNMKCEVVCNDDEQTCLGSFAIDNFDSLRVSTLDGKRGAVIDLDTARVPKYEMADTKYDQLPNTVRQFKRNMKLGQFAAPSSDSISLDTDLSVYTEKYKLGDRCLVDPNMRGRVRFVGYTQFQKGVWVGVELDEPLGKHQGQVGDHVYFNCKYPNHGTFVRPNRVQVGDFPEIDIMDEYEEI